MKQTHWAPTAVLCLLSQLPTSLQHFTTSHSSLSLLTLPNPQHSSNNWSLALRQSAPSAQLREPILFPVRPKLSPSICWVLLWYFLFSMFLRFLCCVYWDLGSLGCECLFIYASVLLSSQSIAFINHNSPMHTTPAKRQTAQYWHKRQVKVKKAYIPSKGISVYHIHCFSKNKENEKKREYITYTYTITHWVSGSPAAGTETVSLAMKGARAERFKLFPF